MKSQPFQGLRLVPFDAIAQNSAIFQRSEHHLSAPAKSSLSPADQERRGLSAPPTIDTGLPVP